MEVRNLLTLMSLDGDYFCDGRLQNTDVPVVRQDEERM